MHNLIVLCGHVGCGKSTLVRNIVDKNPQIISADVYKYIKKYKDDSGRVSDEFTTKAYEELYQDLAQHNQDTILEIGVRNAEFSFKNFSNLKNKFKVKVIFCLLDKQICLSRVIERGNQDKSRFINLDTVEAKFKIPFPEDHAKLAENLQIPFIYLDMSKSPDELYEFVSALFS